MMKFVCTAEQCLFGIRDEKRRTVSSVDFLNFCLNCEYLKIYLQKGSKEADARRLMRNKEVIEWATLKMMILR